jgi:pimeloyl-ACP methyl ester carboxylesterase
VLSGGPPGCGVLGGPRAAAALRPANNPQPLAGGSAGIYDFLVQNRTRAPRCRQAARTWTTALAASGLLLLGLAPAAGAVSRANAVSRADTTPGANTAPASRLAPHSIRVGSVRLSKCGTAPLTYCGSIKVPLDYRSKASPDIRIGFELLPPTVAKVAAGTILAVEGGPGFASTGTESLYVAMAGRLVQTRSMLLVNLRGTGNSSPVNCRGLEGWSSPQHQYGAAFNKLVAACGRQLNHTWHYRHGGWVHASDLFNTAYSARDVSGVLTALRLGPVDLYGDSYGSWFAQVFASRYPRQLRSVTLDSTYQVLDLDPWYSTTAVTARRAFDVACSRSPACAAAARHDGSAWQRIAQLARRLAARPVTGETATLQGSRERMTVTELTLVNLVNNAGFDPIVYRDLDAAGRALLQHDDAAPLLRLAALSIGFDDTNFPLPEFSDGLYFAVSCTDYVQLFSRDAQPAVRQRQYDAALRREPARTFAPFSLAEWTSMDQYTEAYSACLDWPSPVHHIAPITRRPPLVRSSLPVLILSGTLDSLTPWLDGASLVARQMGKSARLVRVASLTHVTLQDANDACPASIYQRFVADPADLRQENVSCAAHVAPVHTVGTYPLRLADAVPARAVAGNTASRQALQAAAIGVAAVGDEISRSADVFSGTDLGLRGGTIQLATSGDSLTLSLRAVRWVTDATIDGTAVWDETNGLVHARLVVHPGHGPAVRFTASWAPFGQPGQTALISGSQGSRKLLAHCPAP